MEGTFVMLTTTVRMRTPGGMYMKKIISLLIILPLLLFVGCSSDDDDGGGGNGNVTLQEVTANTSVSAPTLSSVNETVWNNVTAAAVDISTATLPPTVAG